MRGAQKTRIDALKKDMPSVSTFNGESTRFAPFLRQCAPFLNRSMGALCISFC